MRNTQEFVTLCNSIFQSIDAEMEQERKDRLRRAIIEEVEEVDENPELASDAFAAYFADGYTGEHHGSEKRQIIFSEELGLAIEKPKDGFTLQQLWEVIPS